MDAYRNVVELAELTSIGITPKKIARINDGGGMRLHVETGSIWITQERCQDDVFLKAGDSYCIEKNGTTLISTLRAPFALVTIEPAIPVAPTMAERFWNFWASLYEFRQDEPRCFEI
jgi:hypothetical protein